MSSAFREDNSDLRMATGYRDLAEHNGDELAAYQMHRATPELIVGWRRSLITWITWGNFSIFSLHISF